MTLQAITWEKFKAYLLFERNFKDTESAMHAHKSRFTALQKWFEGKEFTRDNFVALIASLEKKGQTAETQNKYISAARNIDDYLVLEGLTEKKVLQDFRYRTVGDKPTKEIITPEEILKIVYCKYPYGGVYDLFLNNRDHAMFMLVSAIGCRSGELVKLKWDDLIDDGQRKYVVFRDTKSKRKNREVVIPGTVWDAIQVLPRWIEYVFCSFRRKQLKTKAVNEALQNRAKHVGITKPVTTHLLRHSLVTQLLENGADWFGVSIIVGHADPKTTKGYLQKNKRIQEQALAKHPLNKNMLTFDDCVALMQDAASRVNEGACSLQVVKTRGKIVFELSKC